MDGDRSVYTAREETDTVCFVLGDANTVELQVCTALPDAEHDSFEEHANGFRITYHFGEQTRNVIDLERTAAGVLLSLDTLDPLVLSHP